MLVNNETMILSGLIRDDEYFRTVSPFLKTEYFTDESNKLLYKVISKYIDKYKEKPNRTVLEKFVNEGLASRSPEFIADVLKVVDHISTVELPKSNKFMVDETEKFCKDQAMYNAINKAIDIYQSKEKAKDFQEAVGSIPDLMKNALAVSFDTHVGHNYNDGEEARWEYYTKPENKIPFDIDFLNKITNGGVTRKTLNMFAAGVNVGKTMLLVYMAAMYKRLGYDVLYITNEINEMELAQRIDASLLNIDSDLILTLGKEKYLSKFQKLRETQQGRLFIKEFPTGTCSANGIRNVLRELELKQKFRPTIIINDYITINKSDAVSMGSGTNTGVYFEKVAEEMRSLAMEEDVIMWTAVQFTKEGANSSDPELTDIGSSLGLAKVADLVWAVMRNEMLDEVGQISMKQMKTRYHKTRYQKWNVGVNIGTQRIFEINNPDGFNSQPETTDQEIGLETVKREDFSFKKENPNKKVIVF